MSRLKTLIDANIKENGNQEITGNVLNYVLTEIADEVKREGYFPDMSVGFADNLVGRGESVPAEFSFRASGGKSIKDGAARIKRIKGNSVVWNNMVDTRGYEGEFIIQGGVTIIAGHKYLLQREKANGYLHLIPVVDGMENYDMILLQGEYGKIYTSQYTDTTDARVYGTTNMGGCIVSDLTHMFGAGNEPTTIEEYEARKPIVADEYAYNEGEVIHMNTESIKSIGDNAWDEQWEVGGLSEATGQEYDTTTNFRSKNYIKILPNTQYYFKKPAGVFLLPYYYDEDKNFIATDDVMFTGQNGNAFTTLNAAYMRFIVNQGNYGNDIMLTLVHSGWKQDTDAKYQPYWQDTLPLPIIRKYFPDGMKSAGSAHDEIRFNKASGKWEAVQRVTSLDLGSLAWLSAAEGHFYVENVLGNIVYRNLLCPKYTIGVGQYSDMAQDKTIGNNSTFPYNQSLFVRDDDYNDAASFKAAMQGVILYYELAEPVIREIDEPFGTDYRVADFGTEQAISSIPSAPFSADIIYQFNAVDMIRELWLKVQELESRLAQL